MTTFFNPAIGLMNRLKYPGKFAVISFMAVLAVTILLVSLITSLYSAVRVSRNELAAIELIGPLQRVVQLTQQHRGMSAALLSGMGEMRRKLEDKQVELAVVIKEVNDVEHRHSALLDSSVEWRSIKDDWERLHAGVLLMEVPETVASHSQLIERILRFQVAIADASGLTFDNELDTHYLAEMLSKSLPDMLEHLGKLRALGTSALVTQHLTDADKIEFQVNRKMLTRTITRVSLDLKKIGHHSPSIQPALNQFETEITEAGWQAIGLLDLGVIGGKVSVAPQDFFDKFTQTMDIGYRQMFDTLIPTLNQQLEARIARLQTYLVLQVGFTMMLLSLLVYVSFGAYYSIIESVRRLSAGAKSLANGDLAARIHLEGQDELTSVAQSFNFMATSLDKLWQESKLASDALSDALAVAKLADQTKDAFLANMSHELRTPLNAVIGMADLARKLITEPKPLDYLDKITLAGRHLNRIINDLLDLSKIAAGHIEMESIIFRLSELLERCNSVMSHRAVEKGLQLVTSVDASVPDVLRGDPLRIEQILLNLLGNAIKFTSTGRIDVRVRCRAGSENQIYLVIEVADTGVGMPPEAISRLFKPFSQADATVSRKFGGTGLGLAISLRLAQLMNGDIEVTSSEGEGTTFVVGICVGVSDAAELVSVKPPDELALPGSYLGANILVADDQPMNREIIEALLLAVGIHPRMAENGQEVLDILSTSGPDGFDLVLIDIQMPIMDGLTATRELRSRAEFAALPIIAMTAHTMAHEIAIGSEAGMSDHIGKPFDNATVYRKLAKWIPQEKQRFDGDPSQKKY